MTRLVALILLLCLPASAAARRRDDVGRRPRCRPSASAPAAEAASASAPAAEAAAPQQAEAPAVLRVNGVLDLGAADVVAALAEAERSWTWLRELHDEAKLLQGGRETKQEFLVMNELVLPRLLRHLFREQDGRNRERAEEAHRRASAGEPWESLVPVYSTEPGAGLKGDLGVVAFDNLVAPFHRAMFEAPLGVVQPPVQTMFGWHVGKVSEILPPRDVQRADGSVVRRPETRRVQQILVTWDLGEHDGGRRSDLRLELMEITRTVKVEVLDPQWCATFPHWCPSPEPAIEGEAAP